MDKLVAWFHDREVGQLSVNSDGRWAFQYASAWLESARFAVSPHMPLQAAGKPDLAHHRTVEWFFDNLLPEGAIREALAQRQHINDKDTWGLVSIYGRDTAGALSLLPAGIQPEADEQLRPITIDELARMVAETRQGIPLIASNGLPRMSLAGAQEKIALRVNADGTMCIPDGSAVSTHILKPENKNSLYPFCPANEWFCMNLARDIGLSAPSSSLINLPDNERVYCVERFDRRRTGTGTNERFERIHQIDLCQAANVPPSRKYESEGGLDARDMFSATRQCEIATLGARVGMQWIAFNYLIGNDDAHAKNMSFFMKKIKLNPAPFYDLLCVEAYHCNHSLAMSIGGESKAGFVEGVHWDALALETGQKPQAMREVLSNLSSKMAKALPALLQSAVLKGEERSFLHESVNRVVSERITFVSEALRQPVLNAKTIQTQGKLIPAEILARIAEHPAHQKGRV